MEFMDERKIYEFILEAGIKLEAKAVTMATAATLCHRFLKKLPLQVSRICPYTAAAACLYIAGKTEENFLKIRDVTNICHRILHPNEPALDVGETYWNLRDGIGRLELFILRTLAFQVYCTHPHKYLLHYLESLKHWISPEVWEEFSICSAAWGIVRDCYVCPKLMSNGPQMVALACIYLALNTYGVTVPYAEETDRKPWWKIFYPESNRTKVLTLAEQIMDNVYGKD